MAVALAGMEVEAGCMQVGARLKRAGMPWTVAAPRFDNPPSPPATLAQVFGERFSTTVSKIDRSLTCVCVIFLFSRFASP